MTSQLNLAERIVTERKKRSQTQTSDFNASNAETMEKITSDEKSANLTTEDRRVRNSRKNVRFIENAEAQESTKAGEGTLNVTYDNRIIKLDKNLQNNESNTINKKKASLWNCFRTPQKEHSKLASEIRLTPEDVLDKKYLSETDNFIPSRIDDKANIQSILKDTKSFDQTVSKHSKYTDLNEDTNNTVENIEEDKFTKALTNQINHVLGSGIYTPDITTIHPQIEISNALPTTNQYKPQQFLTKDQIDDISNQSIKIIQTLHDPPYKNLKHSPVMNTKIPSTESKNHSYYYKRKKNRDYIDYLASSNDIVGKICLYDLDEDLILGDGPRVGYTQGVLYGRSRTPEDTKQEQPPTHHLYGRLKRPDSIPIYRKSWLE